MIRRSPDPAEIPLEDAREALIALRQKADEVVFRPDHPERIFVIDTPDRGLIRGLNPRIVDGTIVLDLHVPGSSVGAGPPLGEVRRAEPPPKEEK
jgi:hypothetical protein